MTVSLAAPQVLLSLGAPEKLAALASSNLQVAAGGCPRLPSAWHCKKLLRLLTVPQRPSGPIDPGRAAVPHSR